MRTLRLLFVAPLLVVFITLFDAKLDGQSVNPQIFSKRHLGWIIQGQEEAPVILGKTSKGGNYVQILFSYRVVNDLNSNAHGWAILSGDQVAPLTEAEVSFYSGQTLIFEDKNLDSPISAYVFRINRDFYLFKIQPRKAGLTDDEQFCFDQLNNISAYEAMVYESGSTNSPELIRPVTTVRIRNLKNQLTNMGVRVKWNSESKHYVVLPE
jgi:hypothetical protein